MSSYPYKNRPSNYRQTRREEISKQEQLILEKKKEIEQKLKSNHQLKGHPSQEEPVDDHGKDHGGTIKAENIPEKDDIEIIEDKDSKNKFINDGSFLHQFIRMQENRKPIQEDQQSIDHRIHPSTTSSSTHPIDPNHDVPKNKSFQNHMKMKLEIPIYSGKPALKSEHFEQPNIDVKDETGTELGSVSSPEEQNIRLAIEKTAISVAMNGKHAESKMRETMKDNKDYKWLRDMEDVHYKYFLRRVDELAIAKEKAESENCVKKNSEGERKRIKKSRWGESSSQATQQLTNVPHDMDLIQYALQVYGKTDLTPDQWKQLEDQRKMKALFKIIKAKERHAERLANAGKVKYEYDSDEEVDGGTWEHRRRMEEMEKTKVIAQELTENAHGRHHIGDFLPPDELEKFMRKWDNLKDGKASEIFESDYHDFKLNSDNFGFKMLQKLGWTPGQGLGTENYGTTEPINKTSNAFTNAGLGQTRPDELNQEDDEYEAYRKRMMLAYRFRPNPLNNPRREYY